ncbi:MAG: amidohydrolase family protein [Kiritimatiellia bacterium]
MKEILAADPDRFYGLAWINPLLPNACEVVEQAITELGFRGIKMIPHHWYPHDERLFPVYRKIEELGVPVVFHSGILWGHGDSSRFCQPVHYEVLINFPRIRFALAHIGWPWTDECIALAGRFAARVVRPDTGRQEHAPRALEQRVCEAQMFVDITLGAPRPYRTDALLKALAVLGDRRLIYGSDCGEPDNAEILRFHSELDRHLLSGELGQSPESIRRIMHDNFELFFLGRQNNAADREVSS